MYSRCPIDKSGNQHEGEIYSHDYETMICYFCGKVGHMMSKCKDLPRKEISNAFFTNKKRSKRIWVSKNKIIPIADVLDNEKDTPIMVLGQWLLMTHDRKKGICSNA